MNIQNLALCACIIGTVGSIVSLTLLAKREHALEKGKTLSELGARSDKTLREFRIILWTCGLLFAFALYGLILPSLDFNFFLTVTTSIVIVCELLLGFFPARQGLSLKIHNLVAFAMGLGMLMLTTAFVFQLSGVAMAIEIVIFGLMFAFGLLGLRHRHHFLYFELPFIFLSHISIFVAAIAVIKHV